MKSLPIKKEELERLCQVVGSRIIIQNYYRCKYEKLDRYCLKTYKLTWSEAFEVLRAPGLVALSQAQYNSAMQGNSAMQIFLGKNYLGQKDKVEQVIVDEQATNVNKELIEAIKKGEVKESTNEDTLNELE